MECVSVCWADTVPAKPAAAIKNATERMYSPSGIDGELYPIDQSGRYCAGVGLPERGVDFATRPRARVVAAAVGSAPRSMSALTLRWKSDRSVSRTPERASWRTTSVAVATGTV